MCPRRLRDRGASFNGTTNSDRTNYFETLPATDDNFEFAIRFEADRLVNSFVRREDLLSEMTVVRNEFERSENSPQALLGKRMMAAAFDWHNYGKIDDRQPQRHRARADRQPAGLLPPILSARQRRRDRRRQVRRGEGASSMRSNTSARFPGQRAS